MALLSEVGSIWMSECMAGKIDGTSLGKAENHRLWKCVNEKRKYVNFVL